MTAILHGFTGEIGTSKWFVLATGSSDHVAVSANVLEGTAIAREFVESQCIDTVGIQIDLADIFTGHGGGVGGSYQPRREKGDAEEQRSQRHDLMLYLLCATVFMRILESNLLTQMLSYFDE